MCTHLVMQELSPILESCDLSCQPLYVALGPLDEPYLSNHMLRQPSGDGKTGTSAKRVSVAMSRVRAPGTQRSNHRRGGWFSRLLAG